MGEVATLVQPDEPEFGDGDGGGGFDPMQQGACWQCGGVTFWSWEDEGGEVAICRCTDCGADQYVAAIVEDLRPWGCDDE